MDRKFLLIPLALILLVGALFLLIPDDQGVTYIERTLYGEDAGDSGISSLSMISSGGVPRDDSNSLTENQEDILMSSLSSWGTNGSEVYFEDERVYISATDQTLEPVIRLISKQFTGDINIAFGFDTQQVQPTWAGYNKRIENVTKSYVCASEFNYTITPTKHFWCYETVEGNATHEGSTNMIFDHDFTSGDLQQKTAYWQEEEEVWTDVSGAFDKTTFFINNTDTWYYKKNFGIVANETVELKLRMRQNHVNTPATKYWIAFWPSSLTIQEAVQQNKFYALDPWTPDLTADLVAYYNLNEVSGTTAEDIFSTNDLTCTNCEGDEWFAGLLDGGIEFDFSSDNTERLQISDNAEMDTVVAFSLWFQVRDTSSGAGTKLMIGKYNGGGEYQNHISYEDNVPRLVWYDQSTTADWTFGYTDNTWYHLVVSMDGTTATAYIDGSPSGSSWTLDSANIWNNAYIFDIGGGAYDTTRTGDWYFDEVALFNQPINASQVTNLYNTGTPITYFVSSDNAPTVTFVDPANASTYSTSPQSIDFTCYAEDDINLANVSLVLNEVVEQTNSSGLNASNYIFTESVTDGYYNWSCIGVDNASQSTETSDRWFTIDSIDPVLSVDFNITDIVTFGLPTNSSFHYNATDPHLDKCYYNTTDDPTVRVITCNSTVTTAQWTSGGTKTIQFCANDTFAHETCNSTNIEVYSITETVGSDKTSISEGFDVVFNLTVGLTDIPTTTANFTLNNTVYAPDTVTETQNKTVFEITLNIPEGWGSDTGINKLWYWNYSVDGLVSNKNTTMTNLTIFTLSIDDCSSYPEVILNLTVQDEETSTWVNETAGVNVELDILLISKENSAFQLAYHTIYTDDNNPLACIPTLNDSEYFMDMTIGFQATDHVWEFYHLDDGTLDSTKIFDAQTNYTIALMDLLTADSTSFLFNYFDQDGLPVEDAVVHVFRKYIGEGTFKEVERAKADQNGDTIVHLVEEDVIYYFLITQYGIPLYTSSTYTALCQSTPCTIQIEASGQSAHFPTDWDLVDGGAYSISDDPSTRIVNLTYAFNSSDTINLTVYKYNSDGSYSAINTTSAIGTAGSVVITVPQSAGNVSFFATVHKGGDFINSEWVDFEGDAQDRFGTTLAVFLGALIILSLGLMAVSEGVGTLVYVMFGVALSGFLGLITTTLSTGVNIIVYLIVAGGILLFKLTGGRR